MLHQEKAENPTFQERFHQLQVVVNSALVQSTAKTSFATTTV
jgi:hypothetical protein